MNLNDEIAGWLAQLNRNRFVLMLVSPEERKTQLVDSDNFKPIEVGTGPRRLSQGNRSIV